MPRDLSPEQLDQLIAALTNTRKLQAIKIYIRATGVDLTTARQEVEALDASLREKYPERFTRPPKGHGCTITSSAPVLLLLAAPALLWWWLK